MLHTVHSRGWKGSGRFHLENFRAAAFISLRHLSDELKGLNSTVKEIDLKMPTPEMRKGCTYSTIGIFKRARTSMINAINGASMPEPPDVNCCWI